jgi:acetyltransferase-like isoleucine patch superfamily enzyme
MKRFFNLSVRLRGMILRWYLICCGCKCGRGLKCKQWPLFRNFPKGNIEIGDHVNIGWRITFDIAPTAVLKIGHRVNLTQDIVLGATQHIQIGDDSLVAEFVSIRDNDHGLDENVSIACQRVVAEPVVIGCDVWVAAGVRVLRGARIADGCVIAANAVITRKVVCLGYGIYGGVPARCLGERVSREKKMHSEETS